MTFAAPAATDRAHSTAETYPRRAIAGWLFTVAGLIYAMAVIGAITRLTESGLSIVYWRPITGWLPPMSVAEWEAVFAQYQGSPEYMKVNAGMTLAEFKTIFWWEYVHRLWGRLIGVAFALPLVWFLVRRQVPPRLRGHLLAAFALGGLQGVVGWWMVQSGLIDRPDVSHLRLAAHLGLAVAIYGYVLWLAIAVLNNGFVRQPPRTGGPAADATGSVSRRLAYGAMAVCGLVFLTILSGALVAGLDAGLIYNTFPLMDGALIPSAAFNLSPWWHNLFDDIATVQFDHRWLAITTAFACLWLWWYCYRAPISARARFAAHCVALMVCVQLGLGISTLILVVPIPLAAAHQGGALLLFGLIIWLYFELRAARHQI
ncbi:MAG: COX15/CtaA family protein [Alphaproteobacteria bacterium]|nr:COX15/CtaA family protein [Alphaproteobacteria bacterium]